VCGRSSSARTHHLALADLQRKNPSATPVRGLEATGENRIVDEAGELEDVRAGDGKAGEVHRGHGALPSSRIVTGSAAGSSETTSVAA
jgi:hypothetical protein